MVGKYKIDAYQIMETGIYGKKKPVIPTTFNKVLYNNI